MTTLAAASITQLLCQPDAHPYAASSGRPLLAAYLRRASFRRSDVASFRPSKIQLTRMQLCARGLHWARCWREAWMLIAMMLGEAAGLSYGSVSAYLLRHMPLYLNTSQIQSPCRRTKMPSSSTRH